MDILVRTFELTTKENTEKYREEIGIHPAIIIWRNSHFEITSFEVINTPAESIAKLSLPAEEFHVVGAAVFHRKTGKVFPIKTG